MGDAEALTALWEQHALRVLAYCLRHTDRQDAEDVVSETFLVAWRRQASVPADPLPWLLVTARNALRNRHRGRARQDRLEAELLRVEWLAEPAAPAEVLAIDRAAMLAALAELTQREREALLLIAWDGLTPVQAARVAGCSVAAFHVRTHRARARLSRSLVAEPEDPTPALTARTGDVT